MVGGKSRLIDIDRRRDRIGKDMKLTDKSTKRSVIDFILATTHSRC